MKNSFLPRRQCISVYNINLPKGKETLSKEVRFEGSISHVTNENIARIKQMPRDDLRYMYLEI